MLRYMVDTKKIINNHEQRFADMDIFQANTNASLKNLETQVGQLSLSLQKQSKDTFPCDTQKNPKDCLAVTLRSGKELQESNKMEIEVGNEEAVKEERNHKLEAEKDATESSKRDLSEEENNEESIEKENPQKKEEVRVYKPLLPFPKG